MHTIRVIPRLDIKGPNVIKGVRFEGQRVVGRPELFSDCYYRDSADELIYIDTVASLYGRNNLKEIVTRVADRTFIPLTVGGGIRSLNDIQQLLSAGADKVAINTAAHADPALITRGAREYGSQCIVVSVQAKLEPGGRQVCMVENARESTGVEVFDWIKRAEDLGAGEILLTSVDRDGTGTGYDLDLVRKAAQMVSIPVIAGGGAGTIQHVHDAIVEGRADAVCIGSMLHYRLLEVMEIGDKYREEGNVEFLKRNRSLNDDHSRRGITPASVREIKSGLGKRGIRCRTPRKVA